MERSDKKPRHLVPPQAQIPLVIIGIPLLILAGWRMARDMGWISEVPKAKKAEVAKAPGTAGTGVVATPAGTPAPAPGSTFGGPMAPTPRGAGGAPTLETIALPAGKDPLAELNPSAAPPGGAPPGKPTPAPLSAPRNPPPLPPPLPAPASAGSFPSPMTNKTAALPPEMRGAPGPAPAAPLLPEALAVRYPLLRRGGGPTSAPPVALVGTISGKDRSIAVIRRSDAGGAHGRYVRPGETLDREGHQIKSIGSGTVTYGGRGGTRQLALPPPQSKAAPAPTAKGKPPAKPAEEPSPTSGGGSAGEG